MSVPQFTRGRYTIITIPVEKGAKPYISGFNHNVKKNEIDTHIDNVVMDIPTCPNPVGWIKNQDTDFFRYKGNSNYLVMGGKHNECYDIIRKLIYDYDAYICYTNYGYHVSTDDTPSKWGKDIPENQNIGLVADKYYPIYGTVALVVKSTHRLIRQIGADNKEYLDTIWMPEI